MAETTSSGAAVAVEVQPVQKDKVFVGFSDKNSTPRLNSILHATKSFIGNEISRKQLEEAYRLMTDEQIQEFEMNNLSLKDYFKLKDLGDIPKKNEHQAEMKTIKENWHLVSARSIKAFTKKLIDMNEKRDPKTVFLEVYDTYQSNEKNTWREMLN